MSSKHDNNPVQKSALQQARRKIVLSVTGLAALQGGCMPSGFGDAKTKVPKPLVFASTPEQVTDEELAYRFRDITGAARIIDALVPMSDVALYNEQNMTIEKGTFSRTRSSHSSFSSKYAVPKTIRMIHYGPSNFNYDNVSPAAFGGAVLADVTVLVAARIPIGMLDAVRKQQGGFRLKIRLTPSGPLIGWDMGRTEFAGGDFREAYNVLDQPVRMGWYIDPVTKKKIETDF